MTIKVFGKTHSLESVMGFIAIVTATVYFVAADHVGHVMAYARMKM